MTYLTSLMTAVLLVAGGASREDEGQTMAEYGLILAGIAVIVMATVWLLGNAINTTFSNIVAQF
jgi:Flp pilus assembly pilin Flp